VGTVNTIGPGGTVAYGQRLDVEQGVLRSTLDSHHLTSAAIQL
jgi:hypothetical protein